LTAVGRELARLPVDPTVGRMILQAREERALREVLVIAAGLSVQDPRERPLDKQAAADAAHRRFAHPDSDFLTLLNIWEAVHDEVERLSQAKLRRFCREHFLSYTRLREWRDIYAQLADTIAGREDLAATSVWDGVAAEERTPERLRFGQAAYAAIHRSVLAGLLGNVATRDEQKGGYLATHSRKVVLFPGSALFTREERKTGPAAAAKKGGQKEARGPRWIMAAEIMETSRLYARTCARLDPMWALELGAHLLNVSHSEPFWDDAQGRVLVRRKTRLYGLEIDARAVGYGRIDGRDATEIFIREALVNDTITQELPFLVRNRAVREKVEAELTRRRDRGLLNLDEAVYRFYAEALIGDAEETEELPWGVVSSVAELAALVRARAGGARGEGTPPTLRGQGDESPHRYAAVRGEAADERFLWLSEERLRPPEEAAVDPAAFPPSLPVDNRVLPLSYAYRPGQEEDGVTLDVSVREAEGLSAVALDWAVPGHLAAKVEHYLRALPKGLRRSLMPFAETARQLTGELAARDRLSGRRELIREALAARLGEKLGLRIAPAVWDERPLPSHLQVRVRVVDDAGRELGASRDLAVVREAIEAHQRKVSAAAPRAESAAWRKAREVWETTPAETWPEGREVLPAEIEIGEQAGVPVKAYPFLGDTGGGVAVRLGRTVEEATAGQAAGVRRLLALGLRYEIAWLEKDLNALRELGALAAMVGGVDALRGQALASIVTWVTEPARVAGGGRTRAALEAALEAGRVALRGLVPRLGDRLREILELRQALLVHSTPYAGLAEEVARVVPADFMRVTPWERLEQVPRYLKARRLRAERWRQNPPKDAERATEVAAWEKKLAKVEDAARAERLRWLIEEYRVSVFAQELGTAEPVSAAKLEKVWRGEAEGGERGVTTTAAPKPLAVTPGASGAKPKTLKSLNALDGLFRR
jgi:ATP-dependent helicase HrpA